MFIQINSFKWKLQIVGQQTTDTITPINNTYISENKQEENSQISTQELEDLNNMLNELKSNNNKLQTQNKELEIIKTEHQKCQTIIVQLKTENEQILKLKQEIQLLKGNNTLTIEPMDNDVYSVTFDRKPFRITFSNTKDKKNLIVNQIDANNIAYEFNVIAKSKTQRWQIHTWTISTAIRIYYQSETHLQTETREKWKPTKHESNINKDTIN